MWGSNVGRSRALVLPQDEPVLLLQERRELRPVSFVERVVRGPTQDMVDIRVKVHVSRVHSVEEQNVIRVTVYLRRHLDRQSHRKGEVRRRVRDRSRRCRCRLQVNVVVLIKEVLQILTSFVFGNR